MTMQPDATDWRIIDLMRREKLLTNNALARKLGVSEGMVRRRIQRLRKAGVLDIRALLNPDVLSGKQLALVAISVEHPETLERKAREIARLANVQSVAIASGRYDLVVEVCVESNHGLVDWLTKTLSAVAGLSATETFLLLRTYNRFI